MTGVEDFIKEAGFPLEPKTVRVDTTAEDEEIASLRRKFWRDITGRTGLKQRSQQIMFAMKMANSPAG